MIPAMCRVAHNTENNRYGDCVRAAVASIFELDTEKVPHFFEDGCSGEEGIERIREWCKQFGTRPFTVAFDGSASLEKIFEIQGGLNPDVFYLLFCSSGGSDHVVVCCGDHVAHNPAWIKSPVTGPNSNGLWVIVTFVVPVSVRK